MKNSQHFWSYLAQFFVEWHLFQATVVKNIKTHVFRIFSPIIVPFMGQCGKIWSSRAGHRWKYGVHTHCRLDTDDYKHTLRICNHHHHWHNSPFWAKTFFRSFCQLSLFLAAFLQFLSPNFLASSITPSSHLSFALPLRLLPSTTTTRPLLVALCSSIQITCPAHFNPLSSSFYHYNQTSSCSALFLHTNNMSCPF